MSPQGTRKSVSNVLLVSGLRGDKKSCVGHEIRHLSVSYRLLLVLVNTTLAPSVHSPEKDPDNDREVQEPTTYT